MPEDSMKRNVISGTKWVSLSTVIDAVIQVIKLAVIARFITKADFGIVAILNIVLGLTSVFADLGFSVGLISIKHISLYAFSSVFWVQSAIFSLLYIILSLCAPFLATFYETPAIEYLIPISLLNLLCWCIGKLYDTLIHKAMLFRTMAIRNIAASFLSLLGIVTFCYAGFGIYSLVYSTLLSSLIVNVWNFIAGQKQVPLKFHCSIAEVRPFFKIGIYNMGTRICDYFSDKIDVIIIGKLLGMEMLGIYNIAKDLLQRVTGILRTIVSRVSLPALANVNNDKTSLKEYYYSLVNISAFICTPICILVMVFANEFIELIYGVKYLEASSLIQIFGPIYILNSIGTHEGTLVSATGRTELDFYWTIIRIFLIIPLTYFTAQISVSAIIWGQYVVAIIGFIYIWRFIISRIISLSFVDYIYSFGREVISGLVVYILLCKIANDRLLGIQNFFVLIFVYAILYLFTYLIVLYIFDKKNLFSIMSMIKK